MKKKVLLSGMTLLTMFLAVGCSSTSSKSSSSEPASSQSSHKKHAKSADTEKSKSNSNSDSEESSASSSRSNSSTSESQSSSTSSSQNSVATTNNQNNGESSETRAAKNAAFQTIVGDLIKRDSYPAGTTLQDFEIRGNLTNGVQQVAEKKTGHVVANYYIQNGHIYYNDVIANKDILIK